MSYSEITLQPGMVLTQQMQQVASAADQCAVRQAVFANPTSSSVKLGVVVTRGSGDATTIIPGRRIAAGDTYLSSELVGLVLGVGDGLRACGAGLTCIIGGYTT